MSTSRDRLACFSAGVVVSFGCLYWMAVRATRATSAALAEHEFIQSSRRPHRLTSASLLDDDVVAEQLTRNVQFFGLEGQKKITDSFVVVVGLGGVGSHCAHMLLRAGVGRLRLVDFDQVSLSSLNRHCLATREDVGTPKSACLEKHFARISPETAVEAINAMYRREAEEEVLGGPRRPDYVIDAIDNIDTKVDLLAACKARGLPVLAVAGAGAKADPTRLSFVDIAESTSDPLARSVRSRLKKLHDITTGIPVLMSTEKPRCGLVDAGEGGPGTELLDYQVVPNFRIRTIPVLGTTPAAFGMAAAGFVLCALADQPIDPRPLFRLPERYVLILAMAVVSINVVCSIFACLGAHTRAHTRHTPLAPYSLRSFPPLPLLLLRRSSLQTQYSRLESRLGRDPGVDMAEVEVLVREIWRGESARGTEPSPLRGVSKSIGHLHLTVWNPAHGDVVDNLVLLTGDEADAHDALVAEPGGFESIARNEPAYFEAVERRLGRARRDFKWGYY